MKMSKTRQPIKQNSGKTPGALHQLSISQAQRKKDTKIERVDLSKEGPREIHTTLGLQQPKGLNRLHSSVQKTAPVDLIARKRPSFPYVEGIQPSLSFLDETVQGLDKISSDYDGSLMDDLPSPSALVRNNSPTASSLPRQLSGENHDAVYDDSLSELEACMVGLDDSLILDNNDVGRGTTADPYSFQGGGDPHDHDFGIDKNWPSSPKQTSTTQQPHYKRRSKRVKSQAIFMSTDSLQQPDISPLGNQGKRMLETSESIGGLNKDVVSSKKRRVSEHYLGDEEDHEIKSGPRKSPTPNAAEKTGVKPGWEGIDPELFAEYGHIVDLVEDE